MSEPIPKEMPLSTFDSPPSQDFMDRYSKDTQGAIHEGLENEIDDWFSLVFARLTLFDDF